MQGQKWNFQKGEELSSLVCAYRYVGPGRDKAQLVNQLH
jgi:hypothetical protein